MSARKKPEINFRKHGNKYSMTLLLDEENAIHVQRRAQQLGITVGAVINICIEADKGSVSSELGVQFVKLARNIAALPPDKLQKLIEGV